MNVVSIVTVTLNACEALEDTINSVIHQKYSGIQFIVIDGGSTDGTIDIIKRYSNHIDYWVSEPDEGIYDAMNKGIKKASGKWLYFLNSGDTLCNNVLLNIEECLDDDGIDVLYGDVYVVDGERKERRFALPLERLFWGISFCHQAAFIRNSDRIKYDTDYRIAADYKLIFEKYLNGEKLRYIPYPIANYSLDGISGDYYKTGIETIEVASELLTKSGITDPYYKRILSHQYIQLENRKQLENGENYRCIKEFMDDTLSSDKSLVLFGTGDVTGRFESFMGWGQYDVKFFVDNNKNKQGKELMGRTIREVVSLTREKQITVIIMSEQYNDEMMEDIRRLELHESVEVLDYLDLRREYEDRVESKMLKSAMDEMPNFGRLLRD